MFEPKGRELRSGSRPRSGAIREVVELLLKAQGCWDEILKKYEVSLAPDHRIGFSG